MRLNLRRLWIRYIWRFTLSKMLWALYIFISCLFYCLLVWFSFVIFSNHSVILLCLLLSSLSHPQISRKLKVFSLDFLQVNDVLKSHSIKPHWMFALDNLVRSSVHCAITVLSPGEEITNSLQCPTERSCSLVSKDCTRYRYTLIYGKTILFLILAVNLMCKNVIRK